ncbi:hypothetical protein Tco_1325344, partial [Tanacetum coccineum]
MDCFGENEGVPVVVVVVVVSVMLITVLMIERRCHLHMIHDVLYPHLTVTENLVFTTLLSLPESLTKQQKVEQAEAVINQLGLTTYEPTSGLVLLLSEGNPLFFGNGSEIMDYFKSIGFSPSVAMNPVDFLLDLANGISSDESSQNAETEHDLGATINDFAQKRSKRKETQIFYSS